MQEFVQAAGAVAIIAVLGLAYAAVSRRQVDWTWFVGALALYLLHDFLLTRGFGAIPNVPEAADWNWLGKTMSLCGMLAVAALPAFGYRTAGLTLKQDEGWRAAWITGGVFAALFLFLAVGDGSGPDDVETILFQWTMPGLDEEVFYRGVLLLAMNEAFRERWSIFGAPISYGGLLTSVLFGLAHALTFAEGGFAFDYAAFLFTGVPSLLLLWMRERTGSVLLPILAHNCANGIGTLI